MNGKISAVLKLKVEVTGSLSGGGLGDDAIPLARLRVVGLISVHTHCTLSTMRGVSAWGIGPSLCPCGK